MTERSTSWPTARFGDLFDEIARDRKRDVGLEQGDAHFAHRRAHVGLVERTAPAKPVEYAAEPIAQRVEHSNLLNDVEAPIWEAQNANAPADETSLAGVHPWALNIDVCPVDEGALSRSGAEVQPRGLLPPPPPPFGGLPPRRWPVAGPRGGPRRSLPLGRWRSGTRSSGREAWTSPRGPTA